MNVGRLLFETTWHVTESSYDQETAASTHILIFSLSGLLIGSNFSVAKCVLRIIDIPDITMQNVVSVQQEEKVIPENDENQLRDLMQNL